MAILKPNTRRKLPSIELNLDNPRGLISPNVQGLVESAWSTVPLFPHVPVCPTVRCFSLTTDALLHFSGIGTLSSPCVFQEVSRTSCISITLRDRNRFLDWRYSRIFTGAELHYNCSLKTPTMPREKTIRVRLSESEYNTLKEYAANTDRMISEVVRDWIKKIKPS